MSSDLFHMIQCFFQPGMSDEINNLFYQSDVMFVSFQTQGSLESLNNFNSLPVNPL